METQAIHKLNKELLMLSLIIDVLVIHQSVFLIVVPLMWRSQRLALSLVAKVKNV